MNSLRQQLSAWGYAAGWSAVRTLPEPMGRWFFQQVADLAFTRRGRGVQQLARNLRRVLGPQATPAALAELTRAGMRSYARYWLETFRLESMDLAEVTARSTAAASGLDYVRAATEAGRGAILALPHSGNWDVAGLMVARHFNGLTTVAERLQPESIYHRFVSYREHLGMEVLPLTGGAEPASVLLKARLQQGRVVCLLADRDLTKRGVAVDFFGEPTRMPAGPALLSAVTGADLLPTHLSFTADGWRTIINPPVRPHGTRLRDQIASSTQQLADFFADKIAQYPADWHMLARLWLADLSQAHRAQLTEDGP